MLDILFWLDHTSPGFYSTVRCCVCGAGGMGIKVFPVFLFALEVNSEVVAGGFSAGSELIVYRGACGLAGSVRRVHCR